MKEFPEPDVKAIRENTGLSQTRFANLIGRHRTGRARVNDDRGSVFSFALFLRLNHLHRRSH